LKKLSAAGLVLLAGCEHVQSSILLYPRSKVEISLHGACHLVENKAPDGLAYIPINPADAWRGFTTHQPSLEVAPCAQ
jgi:hypothetical protein